MARKFETQSRTRDVSSAKRDVPFTKTGNAIPSRFVSPPPGIAASSSPLWVGGTRCGISARVQPVDSPATGFWGSTLTTARLLGVGRAPPLVSRWSIREQLQEPCYLVELLDRGWTQRNAFVRAQVRRVPPLRPPPTFATIQEEVEQLLGDSNRIRDCPTSPEMAANWNTKGMRHGYRQEGIREEKYDEVGYVRGRSGRKSQSRRSSSLGAVRRRLGVKEPAREEEAGGLREGDGDGDGVSLGESGVQARSTSAGAEIAKQNPLRSDNDFISHRSPSLTETDLQELQGFIDLGFKFPRGDTSPRVEATLPALRLYHAVETVHSRLLSHQGSPHQHSALLTPGSRHLATYRKSKSQPEACGGKEDSSPASDAWMLPSPNQHHANLKLHLRVWAQAVAQNVRQAC